ncbi:FAD-dependent 5-carboxymethylaminomethyl-2-thiouridine(34) oxidoreductase MnmC [Brevundimonas sp. SORGH_AS_0993]|uniref:FAD-dependent 5-carboxymethylaminomethyl-2-thiouridine(34) oxidoreductase MnmC n=1 Tax=Brevundimonas sp. SORGH_AS_0993 TaxID=3041794 RepID=UPI002784E75E|nr:FAD-dependent 5-carboxymethylaminomethyl-2-thiouridine(34) oxidoreductase MnmC [Brevundimonas sp. SORGH_AS_0993]MDQ1154165.1 tRNA 5-methylaminomethyl-2-thiouridine biosynthesis bifunctional protein [Brevundimonas sp. SORGH_AS_0993]
MTTDDASPRLTWTDEDEPRSGRFGDVYFSRDDGLAETRAVFLQGCGLPEAWADRPRFTVAELGFGTGLNIVALLDLWRCTRPAGGRLHVFSIEGFPLTAQEAARALNAWPELADAAAPLIAAWPAGAPGFHRIDLPMFDAVLDLAIGDAAWALAQWSGQADAWFLDGFSPALNPGMWSAEVLDGVAARSAPGARLATFTVAGAVRRGLAERGFVVDKRPGHGRKRERLEARLPGEAPGSPAPRVAVVGAGVAGAAVARALAALGHRPTVIEAQAPGAGGSGFPAGLATPRLDAGDQTVAALYAQALERARDLYDRTPGAVLSQGVLQLVQQPRDEGRFAKIAAQPIWPDGAMAAVDAATAGAWLGEPVSEGGLMMRDARVVRPAAVLGAWLDGVEILNGEAAALQRAGDLWRLIDPDGGVLIEVEAVVVTAGWGAAALLGDRLALSPVRGQADWVAGQTAPAVAWGGYAAPTADGVLFGATHKRGDVDLTPRDEESVANLATLAARLPRLAARAQAGETQRRVAVRAATPDRLPVAGRLEDGLYVLGGLGSRGFCVAPLLADHVAALILGRPSPVPAALAARVAPKSLESA